jgi:hypothetical protein
VPLNALQSHLERIYELEIGYRVEDFLVTDPGEARRLDRSSGARDVSEKLLVEQQEGALALSLYLDPDVLGRLRGDDPTTRVHRGNLTDLATAVEGVSHFLLLVWSALNGRRTSLLELEMQAEVDKYVTSAFLWSRQSRGHFPAALHDWLFGEPRFDPALAEDELERYRSAHLWAARFCSSLERRYLRSGPARGLVRELRRFYRLPREEKIRQSERRT